MQCKETGMYAVAQFAHIISRIPFITQNYNIVGSDNALVYRGNMLPGHDIVQAVSRRLPTMQTQV